MEEVIIYFILECPNLLNQDKNFANFTGSML
jgi:hypothetical protein